MRDTEEEPRARKRRKYDLNIISSITVSTHEIHFPVEVWADKLVDHIGGLA